MIRRRYRGGDAGAPHRLQLCQRGADVQRVFRGPHPGRDREDRAPARGGQDALVITFVFYLFIIIYFFI